MRAAARLFVRLAGLNGRTVWSNEVTQATEPVATVRFGGRDLRFRTGNGRLLWRARTFLDEEPLMMRWIGTMTSDDVVLDIGANAGMYAVAMAGRAGRVYACELDPLNVALIRENAVLNGAEDKIVVLPIACGEADAVVDVHFRDLSAGDALQSMGRPQPLSTRLGPRAYVAPVLALSLDDLWARAALPLPTRIKIDVDGNERTVFAGARKLCAAAREIYYEDTDLPESREVLASLIALGFDEVERVSLGASTAPGGVDAVGFNRLLRRRGA